MTPRHLARARDAVANLIPVVAGVTAARRRSATAEAQTVIDLEGRGADARPRHSAPSRGVQGGARTATDLARTLDAVATPMPVGAGVTTERRRSSGADAHALGDREGAVAPGVRLLKRLQPKRPADG
jgi:hypothetical protein